MNLFQLAFLYSIVVHLFLIIIPVIFIILVVICYFFMEDLLIF